MRRVEQILPTSVRGLLEATNGNTKGQDRHRKLDCTEGTKDGKDRGHTGGPQDKHYGRKDEKIMNNIDIDECKTTEMTGLITPGLRPMGGDQYWLGHRAG